MPAEAWDGDLEIYKMPWEQSGDETQISSKPRMQAVNSEFFLDLIYAGKKTRVDTGHATCAIGRGKHAHLQLNGKLTSRQHAEINFRQGGSTCAMKVPTALMSCKATGSAAICAARKA